MESTTRAVQAVSGLEPRKLAQNRLVLVFLPTLFVKFHRDVAGEASTQ